MLSRFFTPETYKANGFLPFVSATSNRFQLTQNVNREEVVYIALDQTSFYDVSWVDTS